MTTYYVSQSGGNDVNAGTSTGAPWQTLNKVTTEFQAGTFSTGDQILFKRGDTWTITSFGTSLRLSDSSGSLSSPIVLGAYGDGGPPSFYMNGYQYAILHNTAWAGTVDAEYITIQDIEVRGPGQTGAWSFGIFIYTLHHLRLQRLIVRDINATGGSVGITVRGASKHFEIWDCRIYGNDGEAIYIGDSGVTDSDVEHGYIAHNYIYNNLSGIDLKHGTGHVTVARNYIEDSDNTSEASIEVGGHHHLIWENRIKGTSLGVAGIRLGAYYQAPYGSAYGGRYCTAAFNTISGVTYSSGQGGIALTGDNNEAHHNTIYDCYAGFTIRSEAWTAGATQVAKNNLMDNISGYPVIHSSGSATDFDFDYNLYGDGTTGVWYWSGASRDQVYVQGTLNQEANGVFTTWNAASHFDELEELALAGGTVAENAGSASTARNYTGSAPDIGAWEYNHPIYRVIFEERFETDFSAFDVSSGTGMSITSAAKLAGENGFQISITDTTHRYQEKHNIKNQMELHVRYHVNVDNLTGADADDFRSLSFMDSAGTTIGYIILRYSSAAGAWQIRLYMREDSGSYQNTGLHSLQSGWNYIEVRWTVGDAATAVYPGKGTLWLNDAENPIDEITGLTNSTRTVDRIRLGASDTIDVGTSGTLYYDELMIDYLRIGPASPVLDTDANLRLWLRFEDSTNLGADWSASNNTFTEVNTPTSSSADPWRGSRTLVLESSFNQYLSITDAAQTNLEPAGPFTVLLGCRQESIGTVMYLFSKYLSTAERTYAAWINSGGDINFNVDVDGTWASINTRLLMKSTTRWLPLGFVYDSDGRLKIYYRGWLQEGMDHRQGTPDGSTAEIHLGSWDLGSPAYTFDGEMDDVLFFDRALTDYEVLYWARYGLDETVTGIVPVAMYSYRKRRI